MAHYSTKTIEDKIRSIRWWLAESCIEYLGFEDLSDKTVKAFYKNLKTGKECECIFTLEEWGSGWVNTRLTALKVFESNEKI